jgi:hypothetical protein
LNEDKMCYVFSDRPLKNGDCMCIPYTSTLRKSEFLSLTLIYEYMFDMALGITMIICLKELHNCIF